MNTKSFLAGSLFAGGGAWTAIEGLGLAAIDPVSASLVTLGGVGLGIAGLAAGSTAFGKS